VRRGKLFAKRARFVALVVRAAVSGMWGVLRHGPAVGCCVWVRHGAMIGRRVESAIAHLAVVCGDTCIDTIRITESVIATVAVGAAISEGH
jgi:hypothetical protein